MIMADMKFGFDTSFQEANPYLDRVIAEAFKAFPDFPWLIVVWQNMHKHVVSGFQTGHGP